MDWITDKIGIGDYREAQDAELLCRHAFGSILGLISTLDGMAPADLGVQRIEVIPLRDGPGNDPVRFLEAVDRLEQLVKDAPPVLVHCRAGWSRSPAVVAGYLKRQGALSVDECIAAVAAMRVSTIAPEFRALLKQL